MNEYPQQPEGVIVAKKPTFWERNKSKFKLAGYIFGGVVAVAVAAGCVALVATGIGAPAGALILGGLAHVGTTVAAAIGVNGVGAAIGTAALAAVFATVAYGAGHFARSSYHAVKKMNLLVRMYSAMTYEELSKAASKITEIFGFSFEDDDGTPESLMEHVSSATLKRVKRLFRTDPEAAKQYFLKMIDLRDAKPPSETSIACQLNIVNAPSPEFQPGALLQQERDHSHNEVTQQLSSHQLLPQPGIPEGKSSELMLPHRIQKNNDIDVQSKVKYHSSVNKDNLSEVEPKKQIVSLEVQLT